MAEVAVAEVARELGGSVQFQFAAEKVQETKRCRYR
jgi:hypothetical protein